MFRVNFFEIVNPFIILVKRFIFIVSTSMNIPLIKSCDIRKKVNQKNNFAVHNLSELVKEDLYILKTPHKHFFLDSLCKQRYRNSLDFQEMENRGWDNFFLALVRCMTLDYFRKYGTDYD